MDLKEIAALWDKIIGTERKFAKFYDEKHAESLQGIADSEEAICDLDENTAQRLADIEEALCELSEMTNGGNE